MTPDNQSALPPTWLSSRARNVHSQFGEDGIIEAILERLGSKTGWCVEFGAWDGRFMSNTHLLIAERGYSAVFIEGHPERVEILRQNFKDNPKVHALCRWVGWQGDGRLDSILADTPVPMEFDVLSVDIDGNDYHVWKALGAYRPKIVVIEFNPTMPNELDFVQPADVRVNIGSSLKAVTRLGKEKGYELACVTSVNAVLVDSRLFPSLGISDNRPETLRIDTSRVTYLFSGIDGRIRLSGHCRLPWHDVPLDERSIQVVPKLFQAHPDGLGPIRRRLLRVWQAIQRTNRRSAARAR